MLQALMVELQSSCPQHQLGIDDASSTIARLNFLYGGSRGSSRRDSSHNVSSREKQQNRSESKAQREEQCSGAYCSGVFLHILETYVHNLSQTHNFSLINSREHPLKIFHRKHRASYLRADVVGSGKALQPLYYKWPAGGVLSTYHRARSRRTLPICLYPLDGGTAIRGCNPPNSRQWPCAAARAGGGRPTISLVDEYFGRHVNHSFEMNSCPMRPEDFLDFVEIRKRIDYASLKAWTPNDGWSACRRPGCCYSYNEVVMPNWAGIEPRELPVEAFIQIVGGRTASRVCHTALLSSQGTAMEELMPHDCDVTAAGLLCHSAQRALHKFRLETGIPKPLVQLDLDRMVAGEHDIFQCPSTIRL